MKRAVLIIGVLLSGMLVIAEEKVGYLNMDKVFNAYYRTMQENYDFEMQTLAFRDKLKVMQEEYQAVVKEAEKAKSAAEDELLSTAEREENKRRFQVFAERVQEKIREIERSRQGEMQRLQGKQETMVRGLAGELVKKVREYAKANGYTHVHEVSGLTLSQMPALLVYPEDQEITAEVIKFVNQGHEAELKAAQAKLETLPSHAQEQGKSAAKKK